MPGSSLSEVYFIVAMMILIFILCGVSVYFFVRTYNKEMKEREERIVRKNAEIETQRNP